MRAGLLLLGTMVAVAAIAGAAAVSTGGAAPQASPPRVAGFDVSVTFSVIYHVEWREKRGVPGGCATWRDDSGTLDIFARNTGSAERPRLKPLQGRYLPSLESILPPGVPIPPGSLPRSWAELNVLGSATGSVSRLWIQRGGPATTPCEGQPVAPFVPRADDCGRREFTLARRTPATIRAEYRRPGSSLDIITSPNYKTVGQPDPVLSVTVPMGTAFSKCALSLLAKQIVASMGVPVPPDKIRALRNLAVNKTVRIEARRAGVCDDEVEREDPGHEFGYCNYSLKAWIAIKRIQRNPYKR